MERLCQDVRLPERSGLGEAGMLTNAGFIFHECCTDSGIHPCGAERGQACWSGWETELHPEWDPRNTCWPFSHARHRSHTCPSCDPPGVRITWFLESRGSDPLVISGPRLRSLR